MAYANPREELEDVPSFDELNIDLEDLIERLRMEKSIEIPTAMNYFHIINFRGKQIANASTGQYKNKFFVEGLGLVSITYSTDKGSTTIFLEKEA